MDMANEFKDSFYQIDVFWTSLWYVYSCTVSKIELVPYVSSVKWRQCFWWVSLQKPGIFNRSVWMLSGKTAAENAFGELQNVIIQSWTWKWLFKDVTWRQPLELW